jgi:hypothetical protein
MSQIITQATTPLWKHGQKGQKGNIEFLSSFKRLEKEDLKTFRMIEQKEGFACQDHDYEYKVGKNQYGLWLSRRKMGLDGLKQIENDTGKPSQRPPMNEQVESKDSAIITRLERIENALKLVALSNIATTEEERNTIKATVLE